MKHLPDTTRTRGSGIPAGTGIPVDLRPLMVTPIKRSESNRVMMASKHLVYVAVYMQVDITHNLPTNILHSLWCR